MPAKTRPYLFYDVAISICSTCYRKVEAKTVFQDGNVYLLKRCPQHGPERVLIADADFHRPTLHRIANTVSRKGFTDLLAGTTTLGDTITPITENVQLAPRGGALTASARNGLGTDRLTKVLGDMSDEADYVLMDSSPILLIPDNLYMAAAADGIVLVVAVGQTRPRDLLRTKALLERAGTPIVGVVLNRTPVKHLNSYYKQYSAYYGS